MGLISRTVKIKWMGNNKNYYESKGYIFTNFKDEFEVKVEDLSNGSNIKVEVMCDCPDCKNPYLNPMKWVDYLKCVKEDGKYYCNKCNKKLYGAENVRKSKLKKGISFEQWCLDNNRQDILDRWDYELNDCKPNEVSYSSNKKLYLKCPRGIHKSELKSINNFVVKNNEGYIKCNQCNSFAQWGIDNIGNDFLEKYWDYENNTVDPFEISYGNPKKVFIKCQEKDYHGSYDISCKHFTTRNVRCPYCSNHKVHPKDSLGQYILDTFGEDFLNSIWSDKNKKSPFEYSRGSKKRVWWKCLDGEHKYFYREVFSSSSRDFRCPICNKSKGEKKISKWLNENNIINVPQKEFDGLLGIKGGNLSYDFYLPHQRLLIEYQGEFHDGIVYNQSKKDFEKQQEHDRRKREYAKENNINLLEIWYWDFENIENILNNSYIINK